MKLLGLLMIINSLILTGFWLIGENTHKGWVVTICIIFIFVGMFFILQDRAIEISLKGIGTIKAAAKQATVDAELIDSIKQRIEAQRSTIDLVAKSADEAKALSTEARQLTKDVSEKNEQLDDLYNQAQKKQKELEEITEISRLVIAVENDSRQAFNKLKQTLDSNSKFRELTINAIIKARTAYRVIEPGYVIIDWDKLGLDPKKLNIEQFRQVYSKASVAYHSNIVNLIKESGIIPNKEKMKFFVNVLKDDDSLMATFYAGKFFSELTQDKNLVWEPYNIDPLLKWWDANNDKVQ